MGDSFEYRRLSRTSLIVLSGLLLINIFVFLNYAGPWSGPQVLEPRAPGQDAAAASPGSLRLLVELDEETRSAMANVPEPVVERSMAQAPDPAGRWYECRWGPFVSLAVLEEIREQVAIQGERLLVDESKIEADPDYLVYLNSDNNLDNARRLLQELESQNLDAYVIAGGEFVNSVSAGVFSNRARADTHSRKLRDLGYEPSLEALERVQTVRFLTARISEDRLTEVPEPGECNEIAAPG